MKCASVIVSERDVVLSRVLQETAFISGTTLGHLLCHESIKVKHSEQP